jgi:hypothetical protein
LKIGFESQNEEIGMPVAETAASLSIISSVLSITRSVIDLAKSGNLSKEDALALFRGRADKHQRDILDRPNITAAILQMTTIAPGLLQQLDNEARACEVTHIKARKAAGNDEMKKDQADIDAAQCMCSVLRDLKRYNKGQLPAGDFQNWWDSYSCK